MHWVEVRKGHGKHVQAGAVGADELDQGGVLTEGFQNGAGRSGQPLPVGLAQGDGIELVNGHDGVSVPCSPGLGKIDVGGDQLRAVLTGADDPPGPDPMHAPGGSGDVESDVVKVTPGGGVAQLRRSGAHSSEQLVA